MKNEINFEQPENENKKKKKYKLRKILIGGTIALTALTTSAGAVGFHLGIITIEKDFEKDFSLPRIKLNLELLSSYLNGFFKGHQSAKNLRILPESIFRMFLENNPDIAESLGKDIDDIIAIDEGFNPDGGKNPGEDTKPTQPDGGKNPEGDTKPIQPDGGKNPEGDTKPIQPDGGNNQGEDTKPTPPDDGKNPGEDTKPTQPDDGKNPGEDTKPTPPDDEEHQHNFKETTTVYNKLKNGKHEIITKEVCSCGETKEKKKTESCVYDKLTTSDSKGEHWLCKCGNIKTKVHNLIDKIVGYVYNKDTKHKHVKQIKSDCSNCNYSVTKDIEENCNYGKWSSNGASGEHRFCKDCGREDNRSHSYGEPIVIDCQYLGGNSLQHAKVQEYHCNTCDYEYTVTGKAEWCDRSNTYTTNDGLYLYSHCDECGNDHLEHAHNNKITYEKADGYCHKMVVSCEKGDYYTESYVEHNFAPTGTIDPFNDPSQAELYSCVECGELKWGPQVTGTYSLHTFDTYLYNLYLADNTNEQERSKRLTKVHNTNKHC